MAKIFNPPPNWPHPPAGWVPPSGWQPDPQWGPAPPGWSLWVRANPRAFGYSLGLSLVVALVLTLVAALVGVDDVATVAGRLVGTALLTAAVAGTIAFLMNRRMPLIGYVALVVSVSAVMLFLASVGASTGRSQ